MFEVGENGSGFWVVSGRGREAPHINRLVGGEEETRDEDGACVNLDASVYPLSFGPLNVCMETMHGVHACI